VGKLRAQLWVVYSICWSGLELDGWSLEVYCFIILQH